MPCYETSRIVDSSKELDEFNCGICLGVFANPVMTECCRQTYCKDCIEEWVSQHKTCPNDRQNLTKKGLKPVPRVLINIIDNIKIKCNFDSDGCSQGVRIGDLVNHQKVCDFRPNQLCKTCGLIKESVLTHNCIQSLIFEKQNTDDNYLQLLDENSSLERIGREKDKIIVSLQRDLAQSKRNHKSAIKSLKLEQNDIIPTFRNELAQTKRSHKTTIERLNSERAILEEEFYQANSRLNLGEYKKYLLEKEIRELKFEQASLQKDSNLENNLLKFENMRLKNYNETELSRLRANDVSLRGRVIDLNIELLAQKEELRHKKETIQSQLGEINNLEEDVKKFEQLQLPSFIFKLILTFTGLFLFRYFLNKIF